MKKDLKRQIITALAITAVLGAAGGMTAQADFNADTILAPESTRDELAKGNSNQYFYGVTGGNVYLDSNAKDLVGEVNGVVNYSKTEQFKQDYNRKEELSSKNEENLTPDEKIELNTLIWKQFALSIAVPGIVPGEVSGVVGAVNDKTLPGSGTQTIKEGTTLNLKGYKAENGQSKDWVRYYGAIGGDAAVDTGLTGQLQASVSVNGLPAGNPIITIDKTYEAQKPTVIDRIGNVNVNIGSADGAVSVIGGVGGSAAMAAGNLTMDMGGKTAEKNVQDIATITAGVQNVKLQGSATTNIHGNVNTVVDKNATVLGWMNGGLAAGIGGNASSTVTGNTTLKIDGTGRTGGLGVEADKTDTLSKILNGMKGSADNTGVNAVGVLGGGTAVTTLGGTADAVVGGSTTINVNNASVVGLIGGGAAASVDATGVLEQIYKPDGKELQLGKDDGTSDINGQQIDAWLQQEKILDPGETIVPDSLTIVANDIIDGGEVTSTTGDTHIKLEGDSTAIGVIGGGVAAASHTYTWRDNASETLENENNMKVNDAWGASNATATAGRSHITVNTQSNIAADGWGDIKDAVGSLIGSFGEENVSVDPDALAALDGKGAALGVFGGGAAFGQGSLRGALSEGNGATAVSNTNGSDILLNSGYAAGVFGGGAAVTLNLARAEANMTDDVNIATADGMKTIGIFGGGLALSMEGEVGSDGYRAPASETLANSTVGTVNITNYGDTDGIFGGGMAIGNSNRNGGNKEYNDAVSSVQMSNITVNAGTIDNLNLGVLMEATKNNDAAGDAEWNRLGLNASGALVDLKGITDETSIAAGGLGLGMSGEASVETANVTVNDGTVKKDILGGGIAVDNIGGKGSAHVGTSTVNLNGGTVEGSIYAGGAVNGTTPTLTGSYDASGTASTVNKAVVNLNGTAVTGEISGQGYQLTTEYGTKGNYNPYDDGNSVTYTKEGYKSVTESILNVSGTNTLTPLDNADGKYTSSSKIHDFDAVNFKSGSETVVTNANDSVAIISGGKVTVEDGASLNIKDLATGFEEEGTTGKTYQIAADTADTSTFWKDSDLIYDRMSGVYATTEVKNGGADPSDTSFSVTYDKIDTTEEANAAADSMTDALGVKDLRGMFREGMNDGWKKLDKDSGAGKYLEDWQLAENKTPYQKGMLFGEDAAVTGNTVSIARAMADNVTQRLSFTDDYVQEQGWANQDGGVWAKYMHRKYETDGMSSSVGGIRSGTDYDGILVGMDLAKNGKFQSGVAIHYGSGEGDGLISHNDYDAWGITLYGSLKDEEAGTNLMADIGWMTSDNDIDGTVNGTRMSADRDVDAWTIGIRGEKEFVSGKNQIVPYAGLRYMSVNPGSYTTYYNGQAAFHNDAENQDLWLLPIGVSFRNETVTNSGWRITPKLDLSYIWAFGDTDTDMTVNAGGYTGNLYYDVMDDSSWLATLGVEAEKDAWTFGINYGYQKGDDTKNKTWYVTAGYSF